MKTNSNLILLFLGLLLVNIASTQSCDRSTSDYVNLSNLPNFNGSADTCSYSGQVNVAPSNSTDIETIFYWYFYNYQQPDLPVMIWLQGGPGASGMFCLFKESGPLQFVYVNSSIVQIQDRLDSWLNYAHLIFVDQPKGTGFSWTTGQFNWNEIQNAQDFYTFMQTFVKLHPYLQNKDWFVYGESYAGKYAPYLTRELYNKQDTLNITIKGMSIIDPLVFGGLQKTTSRNQIYAGLNIMSPLEMSQYNSLQVGCAFAVFSNASNMTQVCSSLEDYMSNQTSNLDLQDVRFYHDYEGFDLIDYYFNQQPQQNQSIIIKELHLDLNSTVPTIKQPPIIFKSQSGVYETLAKANDIYGDNTIPIIRELALNIPVQIIEGVYDTLDGILPIEFYKQLVITQPNNETQAESCMMRTPMQISYQGTCITKGFTQNCSVNGLNFQLVGVWNAGHMVPMNQLQVSNYLLEKFMYSSQNQVDYCDSGCNCNLNRSYQLQNCSSQGQYIEQSSESYCKCNPGYLLGDCSQQAPIIPFNETSKLTSVQIDLCAMNYYIFNYTQTVPNAPFVFQLSLNKFNVLDEFYVQDYAPEQLWESIPQIRYYSTNNITLILSQSKVFVLIIKNTVCGPSSMEASAPEPESETLNIQIYSSTFNNAPIIENNNKLNKEKQNDQIMIGCASGFIFLSLIFLIVMIRKLQNKKNSETQLLNKNEDLYQTGVSEN